MLTRNDDIYVIAHKQRSFMGVDPSTGAITWELDMNHPSGKSLQKFGRRIVNLCEYNDDVYMVLTGNPQYITSPQDVYTLLCIKPTANSILKILDVTLPKSTDVVCGSGHSPRLLLCHDGTVQVISLKDGSVYQTIELNQACITSDGAYIAGVARDRVIKLYRMLDRKCIAAYDLRVDIVALCISREDDFVVAAGCDRKLYSFVIADPYNPEHSLAIKKLPSRNRALTTDVRYVKEDSRYDLLHQITKILDSSAFVSETASSLDSAYQQTSRLYSFRTESRTTRDRAKGDLLNQVFGVPPLTTNDAHTALEEDSVSSTSTLIESASQMGRDDDAADVFLRADDSDMDIRGQSLESVDLPVAVSASTKTESPTMPANTPDLPPDVKAYQLKDLHIDLENIEAQALLRNKDKSRDNKDDTKSVKTVVTYKSGETIQGNVLRKTQDKEKADKPAKQKSEFEELTPCKPFVLSYKSAVLQQSTTERLQRIKNQFVEIGLTGGGGGGGASDLDASLSASSGSGGGLLHASSVRSGRTVASHYKPGEVVGTYRHRSRSRSPKSSTRIPSESSNKTSRACVIS